MDAEAALARAERVAAIGGWIAAQMRRLRLITLIGTVVLVLGAGSIVDWSAAGISVAGVVGILGLIGVLILTRFAHHLDRATDLPRMLREDLPAITGKVSDSFSRAYEATKEKGIRRIGPIVKGLFRLRKELSELAEEDLAPAQSMLRTFNPFRIILMAVTVAATPVMLVVGLGLLIAAALI